MQNRKKLAPTLFFVLALALAPLSGAGEPATLSLGPLEWLKVWIASLLEEQSQDPPAEHCEGGPLIIPSG
jgi:hypothetical protein